MILNVEQSKKVFDSDSPTDCPDWRWNRSSIRSSVRRRTARANRSRTLSALRSRTVAENVSKTEISSRLPFEFRRPADFLRAPAEAWRRKAVGFLRVRSVMFLMMKFHQTGGENRFQGVVAVGQRRQFDFRFGANEKKKDEEKDFHRRSRRKRKENPAEEEKLIVQKRNLMKTFHLNETKRKVETFPPCSTKSSLLLEIYVVR